MKQQMGRTQNKDKKNVLLGLLAAAVNEPNKQVQHQLYILVYDIKMVNLLLIYVLYGKL
jgi:hypothetical protein